MEMDVENVEIHTWKDSAFRPMFKSLSIMLKKPSLESDLKQVLDMFKEAINYASSNGKQYINFAEAAIIIHQCTIVFAKKVDLLCEMINDNLHRLRTYNKKNNIKAIQQQATSSSEFEVVEEKRSRVQRKHHKEQEARISSKLLIQNVLNSKINSSELTNLDDTWNSISKDIILPPNALRRPTVNIDMRQQIHENISLNNNILCNYEDLQMNTSIQSYNYTLAEFDREFLDKGNTTLDKDTLLQQYVIENKTNVLNLHKKDLLCNFYQFSSEKNVAHAQEESYQKEYQQLCSQQLIVSVSRLPDDVIKPFLDKYSSTCKLESRKNSGFFGMNDDHDNCMSEADLTTSDIFNRFVQNAVTSTPKKRKKRSGKDQTTIKRRKSDTRASLTVSLEKFESFYTTHYDPEDGESSITRDIEQETSTDDHHETVDDGSFVTNSERDASAESNEDHTNTDTSPNSIALSLSRNIDRNVREWTQYVKEKIEKQSEVFNMYGYGTNIIDSLPDNKEPKAFKSLVRNKSASEVARYFVATLQLANTGNIALLDKKGGSVENNFQVKLLNRARPDENLQDNVT